MKTILIDASAILYPLALNGGDFMLSTKDGVETTCVFTFLSELLDMSWEFNSNKFIIVFDSPVNNRKTIYKEYKAKRSEVPQDVKERRIRLFNQIPLLKEMLSESGFICDCVEGFESDDLIASYTMNNKNTEFIIVSNDHDMKQLIDKHVVIYKPMKKRYYWFQEFENEYNGLNPNEYWKVMSIAGCPTDGVPSCYRGIGEKNALNFIQNKLKKTSKTYLKIFNNKDKVKRNEALVRLPLEGTPVCSVKEQKLDFAKFIEWCKKLEFDSFLEKKEFAKWQMMFNSKG